MPSQQAFEVTLELALKVVTSCAGGQEKKSSKVVRSGFEKDVKKGRAAPRPYLTLKPGVNDLGKGTSIGFYSQAFSQDSREILENLKVQLHPDLPLCLTYLILLE